MAAAAIPALQGPEVLGALREQLLAWADDELLIGHRHAEWTGFGPDIESDIALSSIAQEEIGHARLFYMEILRLDGKDEGEVDRLAFDRPLDNYRNAVIVERGNLGFEGSREDGVEWNGDWGFAILRLTLYDLADAVRLETWAAGSYRPLADLARTLDREEKYHRMFGQSWLKRLASATPESRSRVQERLDRMWSDTAAVFEPIAGEERLIDAKLIAVDAASQARRWLQRVREFLEPLRLKVPTIEPAFGGRQGRHSPDLASLIAEMTSVWRLEPGAKW